MKEFKIFLFVECCTLNKGFKRNFWRKVFDTLADAVSYKNIIIPAVHSFMSRDRIEGVKDVFGMVSIDPFIFSKEGKFWEEIQFENVLEYLSNDERQTLEDANKTAIFA